ncbi:Site-specific recombinase XerD [Shimia gijangensis]|uniref:Site-specific recombinase XerD n=1 Tax=Shimia gijangensis TaxID=1470563 RepID=A0A1M6T1C6_9RHOB|nr:tyrosine-type recombinase/integrase [Shimia gijangensis]SHK50568.1 Site-specific recombinase XerD [Shimia gijangensis]
MPFDKKSSATLADAIVALKAYPKLTEIRRRDMISSINRVAKFLNRAPEDLPTDAPTLRAQLAGIHPAQAGISAKSLSNIKTDLSKALQLTGYLPPAAPKTEPDGAWRAFLSSCEAKHQVHMFARLVNYCAQQGGEPDAVDDALMSAFQSYLDAHLLGKDPAKICKAIAQAWNGIVKRKNLPLTYLSYEKGGQHRCRALTTYPQSLQDEIGAYLDRLRHASPFDDEGPDEPLRPTSLRNIEAHLRQYLDSLAGAGTDPQTLPSLADAITANNIKRAFAAIMKRRGLTEPKDGGLHNISATLVAIARHYLKLPEKEFDAIQKIKKMTTPAVKGMSGKNRKRLGQFHDWKNVVRLLSLPDTLMARAAANPGSRTSALLAMHAVAISILLSCPMRAKNLAHLELDENVIAHRNGTQTRYSIRVDAEDVKNKEHIEVVLNPCTSRLLHSYIMKHRHLLTSANGPALFPMKRNGQPRDPGNLGSDIKSLIYRETGLKVHAHLFRHLAGYLYLKERPGDFETVRRLLKHKRLETTMTFYADLSNQWAHEHYDKVVLGKWGGNHG